MIVLRNKNYSVPQPGEMIEPKPGVVGQQGQQLPEALEQEKINKDLTVEQMKLQRQQIRIQHAKTMAQREEEMARMRQLTQMQKMEQDKDEADQKNRIRVANQEEGSTNPAVRNASLYKARSKPAPTVGMPK